MYVIDTKEYYDLLTDMTLCDNKKDLLELRNRIKEICDFEINHSSQVIDIRKATFVVMIEKISNMYSFKLKMYDDASYQKLLNRWTLLLAIGTFLMVIISFISILLRNL